jgi:hypothetical protein
MAHGFEPLNGTGFHEDGHPQDVSHSGGE